MNRGEGGASPGFTRKNTNLAFPEQLIESPSLKHSLPTGLNLNHKMLPLIVMLKHREQLLSH